MKPRDRILDAAMTVFRRHGFRRSSIEQAAEAAGLTRQALYHHFESKEALFRAVIERLHETALAAEIAAANASEKAGGGLADILIAGVTARLRQLIASLDGSPHIEELFSEHLTQARDLYQKYAGLYVAQVLSTIERVCRKQRLALADGMTPPKLAHYLEMAINGAKSAYPAMQPADAFLDTLTTMTRMLVAGAVTPLPKPSTAARSPPPGRLSRKSPLAKNLEVANEHDDDQRPSRPPARRSRRASGRCHSGRSRAHRYQARMRGRRVRRLHRAGGRCAGGELPDAGARRRRHLGDDGRRHRRRHSCIRCRKPSWRTTRCNAGSARRASSSRPPRFAIHGAATKGTAIPSREEIGAALSGHLCRCGAYDGIFNAVAAACAGQFDGSESPRRASRRAPR